MASKSNFVKKESHKSYRFTELEFKEMLRVYKAAQGNNAKTIRLYKEFCIPRLKEAGIENPRVPSTQTIVRVISRYKDYGEIISMLSSELQTAENKTRKKPSRVKATKNSQTEKEVESQLYPDHEVKDEMVIGPVIVQQKAPSQLGTSKQKEEIQVLCSDDSHSNVIVESFIEPDKLQSQIPGTSRQKEDIYTLSSDEEDDNVTVETVIEPDKLQSQIPGTSRQNKETQTPSSEDQGLANVSIEAVIGPDELQSLMPEILLQPTALQLPATPPEGVSVELEAVIGPELLQSLLPGLVSGFCNEDSGLGSQIIKRMIENNTEEETGSTLYCSICKLYCRSSEEFTWHKFCGTQIESRPNDVKIEPKEVDNSVDSIKIEDTEMESNISDVEEVDNSTESIKIEDTQIDNNISYVNLESTVDNSQFNRNVATQSMGSTNTVRYNIDRGSPFHVDNEDIIKTEPSNTENDVNHIDSDRHTNEDEDTRVASEFIDVNQEDLECSSSTETASTENDRMIENVEFDVFTTSNIKVRNDYIVNTHDKTQFPYVSSISATKTIPIDSYCERVVKNSATSVLDSSVDKSLKSQVTEESSIAKGKENVTNLTKSTDVLVNNENQATNSVETYKSDHDNISESVNNPGISTGEVTSVHILNNSQKMKENSKMYDFHRKQFVCDKCSFHFACKTSLITHIIREVCTKVKEKASKEKGKKEYVQCPKCNGLFGKNYLNFHLKKNRCGRMLARRNAFYKCDICKKCFNLKCHLKVHLARHDRAIACDICKKSFLYHQQLSVHKALEHNVGTYVKRQQFTCSICNLKFNSKYFLTNHMNGHNRLCPYCSNKFMDNPSWEEHVLTHDYDKILQCDVCDVTFPNKTSLKEHMRSHRTTCSPNICNICNSTFLTKQRLDAHKGLNAKTSFSRRRYLSCSICWKVFQCKTELMLHRATHGKTSMLYKCLECKTQYQSITCYRYHKTYECKLKRWPCDVCKKRFCFESSLMDHKKKHFQKQCKVCTIRYRVGTRWYQNRHICPHLNEPYPCNFCPDSFSNEHDRYIHVQKDHKLDKLFTCTFCNEQFNTDHGLAMHKRVVHEDGVFECEECGKKFIKRSQLTIHKERHGMIYCNTCKITFSTKRSLYIHQKNHPVRPIECKFCDARFHGEHFLKIHMRTHNRRRLPVKCKVCLKEYPNKGIWLVHYNLTHSPFSIENPFSCDVCKRKFSDKRKLLRHEKSHKETVLYDCNICRKKYFSKSELENHECVETDQFKPIASCKCCMKRFESLKDLLIHRCMKTKGKSSLCHVCNKHFKKSNLCTHIKRVHGETVFPCDKSSCNVLFGDETSLNIHKLKH